MGALPPIQAFLCGRSVLVTGATGFLGQALLRKLILCPKIGNIFLLMRPTAAGTVQQRLEQLLKEPLVVTASREAPTRVVPVSGDVSQEGLGLCPEDRARLCKEVSVVFHSAATVRFVEPLGRALDINMAGSRRLADLCRDMEQIKSLVYVSTAYSNCPRSEVEERVYPPPVDPPTLDKIYKKQVADTDVLGQWPNTYSFSKAMAEHTISDSCGDIPLAIVRPSIVYGSCEGPLPGWITPASAGPYRMNQPISAGRQGFVMANRNKVADIVPVDMTANMLIAAAWDIASHKTERSRPRVYNFVSGPQHPITWGEYFQHLGDAVRESPPSDVVHPYRLTLVSNTSLHSALTFIAEILPARLKDALTFSKGKHSNVEKQRRIITYSKLVGFFLTREWNFHNDNVRTLLSRMTKEDKTIFNIDVTTINWRQYVKDCYLGTREYLNRDPPSTIPQSRRRYHRLQVMHWMTQASFLAMPLGLGTWGLGYL